MSTGHGQGLAFGEAVAGDSSGVLREREAWAEAQRSLAELEALLTAAPIGLGFLDRELRYVRVNGVLAAMNGVPPEQHLGRTEQEVLAGAAAAAEPVLRRVLETGETVTDVEVSGETRAAPGQWRHWLVDRFPVRAPGGGLLGVGIAVLDITGRREAEEALRESEARFRLLSEAVQDCALFMLDPEGRIRSWSSGAERLLGHEAREILGRHAAALDPPEEAGAAARELETAAAEGRVERVGWRLRKDGSRLWSGGAVTALRDGWGRLRGFALVLRDLSERRPADEEAERLSDWRERVIGVVGHDLRNPLTAIKSWTQLLIKQGGPSAPQARALERIAASTERMARLIDDLLDVTRGRLAGGIPVTRSPADLGSICRRVQEELALTHPGRDIALTVEGDVSGEWDPDRVAQVVCNLVVNALKHGAPDAPVRVTVRGAGGEVQLEVHNRGAPLPAHVLPHLFDPFRNALQAGGRGRSGGLGLGLYIVQQIVRAHGGAIEVRSSAAEGTSFTLRWPRRAGGSV